MCMVLCQQQQLCASVDEAAFDGQSAALLV